MTVPEKVAELVERFEEQRDDYRSARYNETLLRRDFLDPFFTALGWDVDNRKGYSERFREVIHEYGLRVRGGTQAVDYCFRLGREPIFLVEAKKPAVDIRRDAAPAYQLRNYGWNLKLPASILTDFEEFAVYDCRAAPAKTDRAGTGRLIYWKYTEYLDHWDRLVELFSPEGIRRGGLDKFVSSKRPRKGTEPVDARFLREIESWRDVLARNLALRNKALSQRELNFAVQRTIDRTIFLRICEDRAIEPYGTLQGLLAGPNIYRRLGQLFERADDRYNSGLFYFTQEKDRPDPPDELTLGLAIDDKTLRTIIQSLYEGPYNFSVLPVEILGQVYEQFLGKVIRLTKGHQAKVEEKPEVKKAGGVYYTPKYIVDYIVEHTVGKLLGGRAKSEGGRIKGEGRLAAGGTAEGAARLAAGGTAARTTKTPRQAAKLRILDPACGSGSFLLGAYQYLLDWHLEQYVAAGPERRARGKSPAVFKDRRGRWRLTTAEKKRILLNNIYGVDIDPQAVEVTKLSLLLKVLEGESQQSLERQLRFAHERALPDLGSNIKCGNSLIAPDFYQKRQMSVLDEEERYRINVFDWKAGFPEAFKGKNPGFDAVIGNPPYGALANESQIAYYRKQYEAATGSCDSFALFMEKSSVLLRAGGIFGMIVQSACVSSPSMSRLRDLVVSRFKPLAFASMPYDVFAAYVDTVIVIAQRLQHNQSLRDLPEAMVQLTVFPPKFKVRSVDDFGTFAKSADAVKWLREGHNEFLVTLSNDERAIIDKLDGTGAKFRDVADIQRGVTPFRTSAEKPDVNPAKAFKGTVRRYKLMESQPVFIQYDASLAEYKPARYFTGPRILLRELISRQFQLQAVFAEEDFVTNKSMQSVLMANADYNILYLLGLLNSRLLSWYFLAVHSVGRRDDFPKIVLKQTRELPFRPIDFSNRSDKSRHDRMVELVDGMLGLHKQLAAARTPQDKTVIQRQIDATDRQIDRLVYQLYDLTDKEIAIVEEATA